MIWVAELPFVSTIALSPCLVTDKKTWPSRAARIASMAMLTEPLQTLHQARFGLATGVRHTLYRS